MKAKSFSTFGSKHNTVSITCLNSFCFFSGVMEILIESDVEGYDADPLMIDKEEAEFPSKVMEEALNSITVYSSCADTKVSSNFLEA